MSKSDFILSLCIVVFLFGLIIYKAEDSVAYEHKYDSESDGFYWVEKGL